MAIRLREVDGEAVACCAAKTKEKPGDIYINDSWHYALAIKFATDEELDWPNGDPAQTLMLKEEEGG